MKPDKFTKIAVEAAKIGGAVLMRHFEKNIAVSYKGKIDPVTDADKSSQKAISKHINKYFPEHTIIGEEDDKQKICSEHCWIVDPLDGTVNFIHNIPLFCVSIALLENGIVKSGAVYAPYLREMFVAQAGSGAWLNGRRVKVSRTDRLIRSLVVTGFPYDVHSESCDVMRHFKSIVVEAQGVRRLGSAALDLCYVAMGRFEAFWEKGLKPWDVAAGALMVQEAGGKVTDYADGGDYIFGKRLLATNNLVHNEMLGLLENES
ncbi:MAG: inositol monophosphatase [Endomicrobiales bacterium]|nr:inositol monophosphatase [Endomicrobiales bacterium]